MQIIPGWHPIIVHFATAGSISGVIALLTSRLLPGEAGPRRCAVFGTFSLCMGATFCLLALMSGIAAVWDLNLSAPAKAAVAIHVKWAFFTTLVVLLLAVWRAAGAAAEEPPSNVFLAVATGALASVVITGYLGAENVYRFGIGVLARGG